MRTRDGLLGALLVAAAVAVLGWIVWRDGYTRGTATASYQIRTDTLRLEIARRDTLYRTDTLRLWRLVRQVDTLMRIDSIPAIAADSARADTSLRVQRAALQSCVAVLSACELRLSAERRLRQLAESARVARPDPSPRPRARAFWAGAAVGAGLVLLTRR